MAPASSLFFFFVLTHHTTELYAEIFFSKVYNSKMKPFDVKDDLSCQQTVLKYSKIAQDTTTEAAVEEPIVRYF